MHPGSDQELARLAHTSHHASEVPKPSSSDTVLAALCVWKAHGEGKTRGIAKRRLQHLPPSRQAPPVSPEVGVPFACYFGTPESWKRS